MIHMAAPSHPGRFIRMEIIEPLGLSVTDAARVLRVTRPALSALPNARASLSPEMAIRIEKAFGVRMDTLLRMQTAYDIAQARARESEIDVPPYAGQPQRLGEGAGCSKTTKPHSSRTPLWTTPASRAQGRLVPASVADPSRVDHAIARLKALRTGCTLRGLSWKGLRDEGRR